MEDWKLDPPVGSKNDKSMLSKGSSIRDFLGSLESKEKPEHYTVKKPVTHSKKKTIFIVILILASLGIMYLISSGNLDTILNQGIQVEQSPVEQQPPSEGVFSCNIPAQCNSVCGDKTADCVNSVCVCI